MNTNDGRRRAARLAFAAVAVVGAALVAPPLACAQSEPKPVRVIAPDLFPPSSAGPAAAAAARAAVVAPTREQPTGACQRAARDWLACLSGVAALSDRALDDVEAKLIAAVARRPQLNVPMRQLFAKDFAQVQADWRALRDRECQNLPVFEKTAPGPLYELRLTCRIRRNLERIDALEARYGDGA